MKLKSWRSWISVIHTMQTVATLHLLLPHQPGLIVSNRPITVIDKPLVVGIVEQYSHEIRMIPTISSGVGLWNQSRSPDPTLER